VFLFDFDRTRSVSVRLFLERNWCGTWAAVHRKSLSGKIEP
jgi:hypothetical protein